MDASRGLYGTNSVFNAYLQLCLLCYTWIDLTKYLIWPSFKRYLSTSGTWQPFSFRVLKMLLHHLMDSFFFLSQL